MRPNGYLPVMLILVISGGYSGVVVSEAPNPVVTTDRAHPFIQHLESVYATSVAAARDGDVTAYKRSRTSETNRATEANLKQMGRLDQYTEMIQRMAASRPDLKQLEFLRCDVGKQVARLAYSDSSSRDSVQYHIILFDLEAGAWKIRREGNVLASRQGGQPPPPDHYLSDDKFRLEQ